MEISGKEGCHPLWLLYKAIYLETDPNEAIHLINLQPNDGLHNAVLPKHEQPVLMFVRPIVN